MLPPVNPKTLQEYSANLIQDILASVESEETHCESWSSKTILMLPRRSATC